MLRDLISQLDSTDTLTRQQAIRQIANLRDPAALPHLARIYRIDPDPALRELALKAGRYIQDAALASTDTSAGSARAAEAGRSPDAMPGIPTAPGGSGSAERPPVSAREREMARRLLDAASGFAVDNDRGRAIEHLGKALALDPALSKEAFAVNLITTLTGLSVNQALPVLTHPDYRAGLVEQAGGKRKLKTTQAHGKGAQNATWDRAAIDFAIYWALSVVAMMALQDDVTFKHLGLVIVDEEHRFGVKDKERLKRLTQTTDVLTLSATPIPRTFYMAMSGLRDLSVIETPPESRLGIKTRVLQFSGRVIREAITRELARGGQVFFLHNRIKSIFSMARYLAEQVPEARVAVGHGQMPERALKGVMEDFIGGRADILVSTSIVESGLDIPNANTMIINRADRFGLADLYQLRGRIGRSSHQAYAYLLVPAGSLTAEARARLQAIEEFSELGAGVRVAALDLEIRGAGNLLGYEQSGRMAEVGLEMYTRILEEVIAEQKGELVPSTATLHPEVKVPWPAYIPEEYIPDASQRLTTYKRLSLADDLTRIAQIGDELADLFGHHPGPLAALLGVGRLRVAARRAGVEKVTVGEEAAELHFSRATPVDPRRVLEMIRRGDGSVRLKGDDRLVIMLPPGDPVSHLSRLEAGLAELADGEAR